MYKPLVVVSSAVNNKNSGLYNHLSTSYKNVNKKIDQKVSIAKAICVNKKLSKKYSDTCNILWDEIEELSATSNDINERLNILNKKIRDNRFDPDDYDEDVKDRMYDI